jgi:putative tryptophan/tyrosine transport system substrate-binding protein
VVAVIDRGSTQRTGPPGGYVRPKRAGARLRLLSRQRSRSSPGEGPDEGRGTSDRHQRRMRRRQFIAGLGGAAAWPLAAIAQSRQPKVGFMGLVPAAAYATRIRALRIGLRDLGYIEGQNISIEYAWAQAVDDLPEIAQRFVQMKVDIIFAPVSTFVSPARGATSTIPIVFASHADPVGLGHVASLSRPGGNITGLSMVLTELAGKELQVLKEAIPQGSRFGVIWNPTTPSHLAALASVEVAARVLRVEVHKVPLRTVEDSDRAFDIMTEAKVAGVLILASPTSYSVNGARLAELALQHQLPSMFGLEENAEDGGLMSYSADILDLYRRSAAYIDKILKGARPSELPVEQASKYKLVINLRTAKTLGLTIPETLLATADEVIQ